MRGILWHESHEARHDDLLLLRVRPSVHDHLDARRLSPGLAALTRLERRGQLHAVHAMDGGPHGGRHRALRPAMRRAAIHHDATRPHTGAAIVQLRHARHRDALAEALRADPHIEYVAEVPARVLMAHAQAPMPALRLWHQQAIRLPEARALAAFREPRQIRVAVLDTGVDRHHPALARRVTRYEHVLGAAVRTSADVVGHGTHVSGIIAAADNDMGVHGMCRCHLTVYKIFGPDSFLITDGAARYRVFLADAVAYRAALQRCLDARTDVINLSLGGSAAPDPHERALFEALLARGTVIVAAMGNATTHRRRASYPAAVPGVIAVGALQASGEIADFSCIGPHITLSAPGMDIWSTLPLAPGEFGYGVTAGGHRATGPNPLARNVRYDAWPGTSMACPQVTAAVAMLLAAHGPLTPAEVARRLRRSADRLPAMRGAAFTPTYGAGRLNVARLLSLGGR